MEAKHKAVEVPSKHQSSRPTRILIWVILPAIFVALGIASPPTALLSLTDIETFVWTYVLVGTVGVFAVIVVQSLLFYLSNYALFPSSARTFLAEFARGEGEVSGLDAETSAMRRRIAGSWQYWTFMFLFAYLAALGFSTFEDIGFIYAAVQENKGVAHLALAIVERVLIGSPMHLISGLLIGLGTAGRDFRGKSSSLAHIIDLPALIHGAWDFSLFSTSALNGNVGWIHPYGKSLLAVVVIYVIVEGTLLFVVQRQFTSWNSHESKTK
ncbi:hypothetical protein F4813DRAFT_390043 [Daldinia decipiens]|uniref:uncharacterized protein n=1 Tax=Daldinia decipiens TaxID=326647 RepID=UPI0020C46BAB|nr:uncharacterized protein F4813DRAFT_390043 [Daldinia decipiens]KAI1657071.1 hypothetical protein F4813DRAFT_390043 [Daldinia decipiens]